TTNPLDETIRINKIPFRIVGVLDKKGANIVGEDQDDIVLIPYTTVQKRLQGSNFADVGAILASAASLQRMADATNEVTQLLVESVLLSCIGGLIGFGLGVGASVGITKLINSLSESSHWPVVISFPAAVIAMLFAGGVGVFFGYYPARKASRLDPIEALRYE